MRVKFNPGLMSKSHTVEKNNSSLDQPVKKRQPNPRLVKIHRTYKVDEAASVCHVHKGTIRAWIKNGLATIDNLRPTLIQGQVLREYLEVKRQKAKTKLQPGEFYCVKCRVARCPLENYADVEALNNQVGNLSGICPDCDSIMNRRVSFRNLTQVIGNLEVTLPEALERLDQGDDPCVNRDLK